MTQNVQNVLGDRKDKSGNKRSKESYRSSPGKQCDGSLDKTLSWTRAVAMVLEKNGQIPEVI